VIDAKAAGNSLVWRGNSAVQAVGQDITELKLAEAAPAGRPAVASAAVERTIT